jgi:hypothetical protein
MPLWVNTAERIIAKKVAKADNGCWVWTGHLTHGYAYTTVAGKQWRVHRFMYEASKGPIPYGLTIDHLCGNKACINPAHLEAVSVAENTRRCSYAPTTINSAKVSCIHGHPLSGDNLYLAAQGYRYCKTCRRAAVIKNRAKGRASTSG